MVQILCRHECQWKKDTCWNYFSNGDGVIKKNGGGGEFKYDIFDKLLRTSINAKMYSYPEQ
jgi:hypothetical protein